MSFYISGSVAPQSYRPMPFLVPNNKPDIITHVGATRGLASTTLLRPDPTPEVTNAPKAPEKKKGRPSKKDVLKEKRAKASEAIQELLESDPSKTDVANYFRHRIEELDED